MLESLRRPQRRRGLVAVVSDFLDALPSDDPAPWERALRSLDTSADGAHRLTSLFEWAKFSHHEPEPAMRDEAIAALVAVRDELAREPVAV